MDTCVYLCVLVFSWTDDMSSVGDQVLLQLITTEFNKMYHEMFHEFYNKMVPVMAASVFWCALFYLFVYKLSGHSFSHS